MIALRIPPGPGEIPQPRPAEVPPFPLTPALPGVAPPEFPTPAPAPGPAPVPQEMPPGERC